MTPETRCPPVVATLGLTCAATFIVASLLVPEARAQEVHEREVVAPTEYMTERVLVVLDISGSMRPEGLAAAIDILSQRVEMWSTSDHLEIGVVAFAGAAMRWPGDEDTGWAPAGPDTAGMVIEWVRALIDGHLGSDTRMLVGLRVAFGDPEPNLTIVFVTDGRVERAEHPQAVLDLLEDAQELRVAEGRPYVVLGVLRVGHDVDSDWLEALARAGGGGLVEIELEEGER